MSGQMLCEGGWGMVIQACLQDISCGWALGASSVLRQTNTQSSQSPKLLWNHFGQKAYKSSFHLAKQQPLITPILSYIKRPNNSGTVGGIAVYMQYFLITALLRVSHLLPYIAGRKHHSIADEQVWTHCQVALQKPVCHFIQAHLRALIKKHCMSHKSIIRFQNVVLFPIKTLQKNHIIQLKLQLDGSLKLRARTADIWRWRAIKQSTFWWHCVQGANSLCIALQICTNYVWRTQAATRRLRARVWAGLSGFLHCSGTRYGSYRALHTY